MVLWCLWLPDSKNIFNVIELILIEENTPFAKKSFIKVQLQHSSSQCFKFPIVAKDTIVS